MQGSQGQFTSVYSLLIGQKHVERKHKDRYVLFLVVSTCGKNKQCITQLRRNVLHTRER